LSRQQKLTGVILR